MRLLYHFLDRALTKDGESYLNNVTVFLYKMSEKLTYISWS